MKDTDSAIVVKNVSKYFAPLKGQQSLKQLFVSILNPKKSKKKEGYWALHDISFEVKKGEFFGIVGRNGSGKSTLLKMMAGVYAPTKGSITINGKLVPFIELGVGFNPELSAKDNVYLNGALLGFDRDEVAEMYDEIVEFAELDDHMDVKLKNFSSGMQVRLAFSIAIRAKNDIVLIDEVLAVGDVNFQRKCYDVFNELKKQGRTIVFVTHSMGDVEKFCDRVLVIKDSQMVGVFSPREAKAKYFQMNDDVVDDTKKAAKQEKMRWGVGSFIATNVEVISTKRNVIKTVKYGEDFGIRVKLKNNSLPSGTPVLLGMNIFSEAGENMIGPNTRELHITSDDTDLTLWVKNPNLNAGLYDVTVAIFDKSEVQTLDHLDRTLRFRITNDELKYGTVVIDTVWEK